ncbi:MAG: hypothetical protein JWR85_2345 [Marmoricola sp.]|nr:hypothetical protein [Marmoricola sp.]
MKLRRWVAPSLLMPLLLVSGCAGSDLTPGTASVVDGTRISMSEVSELADAQCSGVELAVKAKQSEPSSRKLLVQQALSLLIDVEVNLKFAKTEGLQPRPAFVSAMYAQVEPLIEALPKDQRGVTEDVFHRWAQGRDMLTQVGERTTGQTLSATNEQQLLEAGYQQREPWLKKITIDTDARYSPNDEGFPGAGDGSVSKPTTTFAKAASSSQPTPAFIGELPPNQRCG